MKEFGGKRFDLSHVASMTVNRSDLVGAFDSKHKLRNRF